MGTEYETKVLFNLLLANLRHRKNELKENNEIELINDIIKEISMIRDDSYGKEY